MNAADTDAMARSAMEMVDEGAKLRIIYPEQKIAVFTFLPYQTFLFLSGT